MAGARTILRLECRMETSSIETVGEEKTDLKQLSEENQHLEQLSFEFINTMNETSPQKQQPAENQPAPDVAPPAAQSGEEPESATTEQTPASESSSSENADEPTVTADEPTPEDGESAADAEEPASEPPAKQSSNPTPNPNQNRPRLFAKRKKKEPLSSATARVYRRMIELATGLKTPPIPPIGYWTLRISYSKLGEGMFVCKRNMQRVMKLLKKTGKVEVEEEPTFTSYGCYRIFPEKQISSPVQQ